MDLAEAVQEALGALRRRRSDLKYTQGDSDWAAGMIARVNDAIDVLTDMLPPDSDACI